MNDSQEERVGDVLMDAHFEEEAQMEPEYYIYYQHLVHQCLINFQEDLIEVVL